MKESSTVISTERPGAPGTSPFSYRLKRQVERFGDLSIELDCLESLDQTIDALFDYLKTSGRENELETLCPYFGVVWPSARALALELTEQGRPALEGRTVLELGCGLALPALVAAKLGAQVAATDFHPEVPRFLERNLANNACGEIEYLRLDWKGFSSERRYDRVIGSDILYERHQPELVARAIRSTLAPGGEVVIADPGRPYLQEFVDQMKGLGFQEEIRVRTVSENDSSREIFVLTLRSMSVIGAPVR